MLIWDILFPRHCAGCDMPLPDRKETFICPGCQKTMVFKNATACAFCKSPVIAGKTCHFCGINHFLDRLLVTTSYENPLVEKTLKLMKYRFIKTLASDAAFIMARYLGQRRLREIFDEKSIIVVPVPLHRLRENWRGFNQSEIMANEISRHFGWQIAPRALKRSRGNSPQAQIPDRAPRIENMKGIFKCTQPELVKDGSILLIDDVSTTGATLDDCARSLKAAGAKEVIGFVFARNKM